MGASATGLLLCDDLIFASRILGTARDLGLSLQSLRSIAELPARLDGAVPCCIIVDLANPGLNLETMMTELRARCTPMPRVVGYGSHVDTATLRAARAAGCDPVLPRSKFVEELPTALPSWWAPTA